MDADINVRKQIVPIRTLREHYNRGRADFFRGKLDLPREEGSPIAVHNARDAVAMYNVLPIEAQRYCDGWFDVRDMQRMAAQDMGV